MSSSTSSLHSVSNSSYSSLSENGAISAKHNITKKSNISSTNNKNNNNNNHSSGGKYSSSNSSTSGRKPRTRRGSVIGGGEPMDTSITTLTMTTGSMTTSPSTKSSSGSSESNGRTTSKRKASAAAGAENDSGNVNGNGKHKSNTNSNCTTTNNSHKSRPRSERSRSNQRNCLGPPQKKRPKRQSANGEAGGHGRAADGAGGDKNVTQTKNTVALLNELRKNVVYEVESQSGPVHAPVFTMSVLVSTNLTFLMIILKEFHTLITIKDSFWQHQMVVPPLLLPPIVGSTARKNHDVLGVRNIF